MKIRSLLLAYKGIDELFPSEILEIKIGDKLYDPKYIKIKKYLIENARTRI